MVSVVDIQASGLKRKCPSCCPFCTHGLCDNPEICPKLVEPPRPTGTPKCPSCCPICNHGFCADPVICPESAGNIKTNQSCPSCCPNCYLRECADPKICPNSVVPSNQAKRGMYIIVVVGGHQQRSDNDVKFPEQFFKFLGINVNEQLDWEEHCKITKGKINNSLFALYQTKNFLLKEILILHFSSKKY